MTSTPDTVAIALEQVVVTPGSPAQNRDICVDRAEKAFVGGADLVALPELAISGYVVDPDLARQVAEPLDGPTAAAFSALAGRHSGMIVYGFAESAGADPARSDLFNTVVVVDGDGPVLHYRKLHLFDRELAAYTPGDKGLPVAKTRFGVLGVCICYDLRFVEVLRTMSLRGAEIVIAPAAWVGGYDTRVPVAGATRHAESVIAQANLDQVAVVAVSQVAGAGTSGPATLGGSVAVDAYGELLTGPLSRTSADSALVELDLAAVRSAQVRSARIRPREDRRTDVYGVRYEGRSW